MPDAATSVRRAPEVKPRGCGLGGGSYGPGRAGRRRRPPYEASDNEPLPFATMRGREACRREQEEAVEWVAIHADHAAEGVWPTSTEGPLDAGVLTPDVEPPRSGVARLERSGNARRFSSGASARERDAPPRDG